MTTRGVLAKRIYFLLPYLMGLFSQRRWLLVLFIFFPCWAGHILPIFHCFCPLSIDLPLHSLEEMEQVIDLSPVLSPSPATHSCPTPLGFLLGYFICFWKLAWHSLNIAKQTLCVYCHVTLFFCGDVCFVVWLGFFCPLQVNQHQTKVVPYKKVHLTAGILTFFPFPWSKSLSYSWKETFIVPCLIKSTAHCRVPWYLSPDAHLSLLKTEHQKSKGTSHVSGNQVQFTSRFTLHALPIHLQSTPVQNKVSVSRQHTDRQFSPTVGCSRLGPGTVSATLLCYIIFSME